MGNIVCVYIYLYIYMIYGDEDYSKWSKHKHFYQEIIVLNVVLYNEQKSHEAYTSLLFYFIYVFIKSKLLTQ